MRSDLKNITDYFSQVYLPKKALLFYEHAQDDQQVYLESYDCSSSGKLINAHPLSEREIENLARVLHSRQNERTRFLSCTTLLPDNLLYLNTHANCAVWYTPPQRTQLYFIRSLGLIDGALSIPALIWKATDQTLSVFATTDSKKPVVTTPLFHAPFFNLYPNGTVCMGTVDADMSRCHDLNDFIIQWQAYFFNSKFSHVIGEHKATRTPLPELYALLLNTPADFPPKQLIRLKKTLQNILL